MSQVPEELREDVLLVNEIVVLTSFEINQLILNKIEKYSPKEKWLIYSRIVNFIMSNHYGAQMKSMFDIFKEKENEIKKEHKCESCDG